MKRVVILGAGKIGTLVALLLLRSKKYHVHVIDQNFASRDIQRLIKLYSDLNKSSLDVTSSEVLKTELKNIQPDAVISCLPYFLNKAIAEVAKDVGCGYFDLTEDVETTHYIKSLAEESKSMFVPQCGLAPGMIGLIAHDFMHQFDSVEKLQLRVGALPQFSNNGLKYALNWSTDGIINEYDNPCEIIKNGKVQMMPALESLENIELMGTRYEAFSTSGGLGSLVELLTGKIEHLNYKTIRYPGHCEKMRFLLRDLHLQNDRPLLKKILEEAMPRTYQDQVFMIVNAIGFRKEQYEAKQYIKTIMPQTIDGFSWSAIQLSTASGLCAVLDVLLDNADKYSGFVYQETLPLEKVLQTPFAECYRG